LKVKYYAFGTKLASIAKPGVIASIPFIFIKKMMIWATKQYFKNFKMKLFPTLGNLLGAKKIKS
jgi:hypothetical protein